MTHGREPSWPHPNPNSTGVRLEYFGALDGWRDVGTTGVFEAELDGRRLSLERVDEGFVDEQTGSVWNVLGEPVEAELAGRPLARVAHVDTSWFA